jgi:hypothetical protein
MFGGQSFVELRENGGIFGKVERLLQGVQGEFVGFDLKWRAVLGDEQQPLNPGVLCNNNDQLTRSKARYRRVKRVKRVEPHRCSLPRTPRGPNSSELQWP